MSECSLKSKEDYIAKRSKEKKMSLLPLKKEEEDLDGSVPAWQQPGVAYKTHQSFGHSSQVGTSMPVAPYESLQIPEHIKEERESIFHPVKAVDDLLGAIDRLTKGVDLLFKQMILERTFTDQFVSIGATVNYVVDFKERKYLYMLSGSDITLLYPGGSIGLQAGVWKNIGVQRGASLTVSGGSDVLPNVVLVRYCDVPMIDSGSTASTLPVTTSVLSNVTGSVSSGPLAASNPNRKGLYIYNDSSATLYIAFAPTASISSFTTPIPGNDLYEMPLPIYTGTVSGLWSGATGFARVSELS